MSKRFGIKLRVWGERAAFNRPEMKVERVSYDVMTPSAARGILTAIYWKPEIQYVIDRIHVLNPITWSNVRRNEISSVIPTKTSPEKNNGIQVSDDRQQRAGIILKNVNYGIEAHFEVLSCTDNNPDPAGKHIAIFEDRAKRGRYFHHPYFGTREFPVNFEWTESFPPCHESLNGERDLGYMLHDIIYHPWTKETPNDKGKFEVYTHVNGKRTCKTVYAEPHFFRAVMKNGIIEVPELEAEEVKS